MNQNQIFLILEKLGDIQSVLSANTQKIENIHDSATKDQKVLDELVKDRTSFKVFCAEQAKINSKLNGIVTNHQLQLDAMPDTIRREIFGQVNKLQETVDKVEREHSEEAGDKRKTWLEIVKHAFTAGITYLFVKLG